MAALTSHKFVQDADATTWVSLQRSTENNQEREKVAKYQFALIRRLIVSFKEAFDFLRTAALLLFGRMPLPRRPFRYLYARSRECLHLEWRHFL